MALLDPEAASEYCGLPLQGFRNAYTNGRGPSFIMPTRRKAMFDPRDLDRWIASWVRRPAAFEMKALA
jgi:hypothetical protein